MLHVDEHKTSKLQITQKGEKVALNRGVRMCILQAKHTAIRWISKSLPAQTPVKCTYIAVNNFIGALYAVVLPLSFQRQR